VPVRKRTSGLTKKKGGSSQTPWGDGSGEKGAEGYTVSRYPKRIMTSIAEEGKALRMTEKEPGVASPRTPLAGCEKGTVRSRGGVPRLYTGAETLGSVRKKLNCWEVRKIALRERGGERSGQRFPPVESIE